jgi:hypothetical protein
MRRGVGSYAQCCAGTGDVYADAWLTELVGSLPDARRFLAQRVPAAERAAIVDALRHKARAVLVHALQEAGMWQGAVLGRRRFESGARAVAMTTALTWLQGDDEALLFRANALMADRHYRAAGEEFEALAARSIHSVIRGFARLGLAVSSSLAGEREHAAELCLSLVDSPVEGIARGGALSLLVQSARKLDREAARLALERCHELDGPEGLAMAARLLTNYSMGPDATRAGEIESTLRAAGELAHEVRLRWKELVSCC